MAKTNLEIAKAVIEKNGKYLLGLRELDARSYPEKWDFFGGQLDSGETPEDSVVREAKEETTLDITPNQKVKETVYEDAEYVLKLHYYQSTVISDVEIKLSTEHTEYQWFSKAEISNLQLHPSVSVYFD